jgi:hypothetical protein
MRRKYRYNAETKEMEEITDGPKYVGGIIMGDIEPFISPVDGSCISSRSVLRDHMRQHGLAYTDDYNKPGGFWEKKQKARADYLAGRVNPDSKARKSQMSDAFEHLRNKMRYSRG